MKKVLIFISIIVIIALTALGIFVLKDKNKPETINKPETTNKALSDNELSDLALDYFMKNNSPLLTKDEYNVGVSEEVLPKYQNKDMVVIEIRHLNGSNSALDARYYVNVYTAKGFDDMEKEIDLNSKE